MEKTDGFGNRIITASSDIPHVQLDYACTGVVELSTYCLPELDPHPMYHLPSKLTTTTPDMKILQPELTGDVLHDSLQIVHAVHQYVCYTPGTTDMHTTAQETFRHGLGVCQDYAHLMIALCRKVGIPARYVCGMMIGEGQTHAWVEVYDGFCWYAFDPTNDTAVATGYIKLAHGRDASDCPVSRGVFQGITREETRVNVSVKEIQ